MKKKEVIESVCLSFCHYVVLSFSTGIRQWLVFIPYNGYCLEANQKLSLFN